MPPVEILLFVLFVFIIPLLLYCGLKRILNPIPLWLFPLFAILVIDFIYTGVFSRSDTYGNDLVLFTLCLLISTFAVISPYPAFEKRIRIKNSWIVLCSAAFIGATLFLMTTLGEIYVGRPWPAFSSSLPLTGWIFDGLVNLLHASDLVYAYYSPVYRTLWVCGFYLEILVIAIVYYAVLGRRFPGDTNTGRQ
ncbi:hypothetical protein [Methanoregula sp. UBA64]|uniref:hypothetical protein n=1 Tax=Methanoregula sp. UBA64 TaxID=1915554 RepID=UPI0025D09E76|nr:hypothetical protein [Methanoregula sp. UBA64]